MGSVVYWYDIWVTFSISLLVCFLRQSPFCDPGWPQAHYDHPALASLDGGSKGEMLPSLIPLICWANTALWDNKFHLVMMYSPFNTCWNQSAAFCLAFSHLQSWLLFTPVVLKHLPGFGVIKWITKCSWSWQHGLSHKAACHQAWWP